MWLAFVPCVCWALGSVCTARATRGFGAVAVNRWRLAIALTVLGAWLVAVPGLPSQGWGWLLLSGVIGLGIGDLAMMTAYSRIGPFKRPRLAVRRGTDCGRLRMVVAWGVIGMAADRAHGGYLARRGCRCGTWCTHSCA